MENNFFALKLSLPLIFPCGYYTCRDPKKAIFLEAETKLQKL